jgi:hypothetical protein
LVDLIFIKIRIIGGIGFPEFVRPLIELEQYLPESIYINVLTTYPRFEQGAESTLLAQVDRLAPSAGRKLISIVDFAGNSGALRLYPRLGFQRVESRSMAGSGLSFPR